MIVWPGWESIVLIYCLRKRVREFGALEHPVNATVIPPQAPHYNDTHRYILVAVKLAELLMCVTLDGFRTGRHLARNLRCADDNVSIASTDSELQELVRWLHTATKRTGMKN